MVRTVRYFSILLCLVAWSIAPVLPCHAQELSGEAGLLPPRPENHVRDHAGLFIRDPEGLSKISERLQQLATKHRYHVYVVIESALMGELPVELAARLQAQWLPDNDGFVVVYQSDERKFGVAPPDNFRMLDENLKISQIPPYAMVEMLERVGHKLGDPDKMRSDTFLDEFTALLVAECETFFEGIPKETIQSSAPFLLLWCAVAIAGVGGTGWWIVRKLGKVDQRNSRTFYFPEREDAQRLGAPFGAKVISRRFSGQSGESS
jgi:hypothetical protein